MKDVNTPRCFDPDISKLNCAEIINYAKKYMSDIAHQSHDRFIIERDRHGSTIHKT
jgi:hypothetical protein